MSLAGSGVVAIWNGIEAHARAEFYEWHTREHMPERVGIAGFLRGRRYIALSGTPEYFTLYETENLQVLTGADYTARLNDPTPWTRKCVAAFTDVERALCEVAASLGHAQGGLMMTLRYDVLAGSQTLQRDWLVGQALPALLRQPGICGAHLCLADAGASTLLTEEKKVRPHAAIVPNWVVLVECASERADIEAACAELLPDSGFTAAGSSAAPLRGLYLLQNSVSRG
jgi:hypothetical protein